LAVFQHQFAEILQELEKMTPQSQAVLDKQKAIYEYFYGSFHPGSKFRKKLKSRFQKEQKDEHEAVIYPGIKRPRTKSEKEDTEPFAQGLPAMTSSNSLRFSNGGQGKGKVTEGSITVKDNPLQSYLKSCNPEWLFKWEEYNLDLNFMCTFLTFLKVEDKSAAGQDAARRVQCAYRRVDPQLLAFMKSQFWVSGILGADKTLR
jgi:hypothetical protein